MGVYRVRPTASPRASHVRQHRAEYGHPRTPLPTGYSRGDGRACEASPLANVSFRLWRQRLRLLTLELTAVWVLKFERTVWPRGRGPPHDWGQIGRTRGSPAWATLATGV